MLSADSIIKGNRLSLTRESGEAVTALYIVLIIVVLTAALAGLGIWLGRQQQANQPAVPSAGGEPREELDPAARSRVRGLWGGAAISAGVALVFALLPTSWHGVNCGSLVVRSNDSAVRDLTNAMSGKSTDFSGFCADQQDKFLPFVIVFAVIALALLIAANYFKKTKPKEAAASAVRAMPVADQIADLADLRDQGVLTDEEFAAAKVRLLGGIDRD